MPDGWQSRAMCCEGTEALGLPAEVIEALSRYRRLLDQREWDWGDDQVEYFRWERFSQLGPVLEAFAATGDWPSAVRSVIDHDVPAGVVVVRVDAGGGLRAEVGPARTTIPGRTVPAESLRVACARGIEFERAELDVRPAAGETRTVECDPRRLFDPAADGWYGGDLHVHMNYSGDLICTPGDAARMQLGEGLHLANLVAANCLTSLVYDRDMLERFAGADLPWSTDDMVARMGVEYRNDLFGHVHALGPSEPPARYYTGHERSDHPRDWPPNKVACEELRGLGATVGYCFSHLGTASNPPGWGRVYARLGDQALSVPAFKDAIRAGRTVVTNGPWLVLEVNGQGPGAVLDLAVGGRLDLRACVRGPGAERLTLVGPGWRHGGGRCGIRAAAGDDVAGRTDLDPGRGPRRRSPRHARPVGAGPHLAGVRRCRRPACRPCGRRPMVPGAPRHARAVRGPARPLRSGDPRRRPR